MPSSFLFLLTSSSHGPVARTRSFQTGMACCFSVSQEGSPRNLLSQRSLQDLFFHEQSTHATRIKGAWKRELPGTSPMKFWGCSPLECVRGTVRNVRHYILDPLLTPKNKAGWQYPDLQKHQGLLLVFSLGQGTCKEWLVLPTVHW